MGSVEIIPATWKERRTIENLFQLYIHDFSELWVGTHRGEVDDEGRFEGYPLEHYWSAPGHIPLLFRVTERLVGFALLNKQKHADIAIDRNVAEFFVLRKYRRAGVGTAAAHALFTGFPGIWEVAVARKNEAALSFWRRTIAGFSGVEEAQEFDIATPNWNGPLFRFRSVGVSLPIG